VILNDSFAYCIGKKFGKTQLIGLSPKKTREGFIGALIVTQICAIFLPILLMRTPILTCPIRLFNRELKALPYLAVDRNCNIDKVFISNEYEFLNLKFSFAPFQIHCFFIALFISLIGPFGGFLASGFKRAYKLKDFGHSIPGHGGILDRFDVHIFVAFFTSTYYASFVKDVDLSHVMNMIEKLSTEDKQALIEWVKTF